MQNICICYEIAAQCKELEWRLFYCLKSEIFYWFFTSLHRYCFKYVFMHIQHIFNPWNCKLKWVTYLSADATHCLMFEGCLNISESENVIVCTYYVCISSRFFIEKYERNCNFCQKEKNLPIWSSWTYSTCIIHFLLFFFNKRMMAYMGMNFWRGFSDLTRGGGGSRDGGVQKNSPTEFWDPLRNIWRFNDEKTHTVLMVFNGFQHYSVPLGRKKFGCD